MVSLKIRLLVLITLSSVVAGVQAEDGTKIASALKLLNAEEPKVSWNKASAIVADVTCDGAADVVVIGHKGKNVAWVGVIPGATGTASPKPITMSFDIGKQSQDSFCAIPIKIITSPVNCQDEDIGVLPGCKVVKGCLAFRVDDGECDAFNFYWDHSQKKLVWWRH